MRTLRGKIRKKMNNSGLTLLEILITIAILGLISVPLLSNFMVSMRTNGEARKVQDATQTAQNVAEAFETIDLNKLLEDMNSAKPVLVGSYNFSTAITGGGTKDSDGNSEGYELTFTSFQKSATADQAYIPGDGSEKYVAEVELAAKSGKSDLPDITDIGNGNANTLRVDEEYYKFDAENVGAGAKKTVINIKCTHSVDKLGEYVYDVDMDITYGTGASAVVKDNVYIRTGKSVSRTLGNVVNLYLFCNYYDMAGLLSSDKIEINYTYDANGYSSSDDEYVCNVYLMAQQNIQTAGHGVSLNPANVTITKTGVDTKNMAATVVPEGLKVYSNVNGITGIETKEITKVDGTKETKTLTASQKSIYSVYDLNVSVYECDASGNKTSSSPVARVNTTIAR